MSQSSFSNGESSISSNSSSTKISTIQDQNKMKQQTSKLPPINQKILKRKIERKYSFSSKRISGKRGLKNLGNTCYLNSALQCLHKTYELQQACEKTPLGNDNPDKKVFMLLFEELTKDMPRPFSPKDVKRLISNYNPMFSGYSQHDSGEVMGTVLRMIHDYTNEGRK